MGSEMCIRDSYLFVDKDSGNVGIGLSSPTSTLAVLGDVHFQAAGGAPGLFYDQANNRLGLGTTTPDSALAVVGRIHATSTTEQLRLSYDVESSKYASFTIDSDGDLTIDLASSNSTTTISDNLSVLGYLNVEGAATTTGSHEFLADVTVSGTGNILFSTSGTINQTGAGQVTLAGNLDATAGLDVSGANLTATTTVITAETSNLAALTVQQDSTGDIVDFKDGASSVFTIADGGNISLTGSLTWSSDTNLYLSLIHI